jgi:hypothetical protein
MSAGLHVEKNAKMQDAKLQSRIPPFQSRISDQNWNPVSGSPGIQSTPEPSVDSKRSQGGLLRVGNGHLENHSGIPPVHGFQTSDISEGDEAKIFASKPGLKATNSPHLEEVSEDSEENPAEEELFQDPIRSEDLNPLNSLKDTCDQKLGEAPSPSPPRATGPLRMPITGGFPSSGMDI